MAFQHTVPWRSLQNINICGFLGEILHNNIMFLKHTIKFPCRIWANNVHPYVLHLHVVSRSLWSSCLCSLQLVAPGNWNGDPLLRPQRTWYQMDCPHSPWTHRNRHSWSTCHEHTTSSQLCLVSTQTEDICYRCNGYVTIRWTGTGIHNRTLPYKAL